MVKHNTNTQRDRYIRWARQMNCYKANTHVAVTRSRSRMLPASRRPLQLTQHPGCPGASLPAFPCSLFKSLFPPCYRLVVLHFELGIDLHSAYSFVTCFCDLTDTLVLPIFDLQRNEIILHEHLCVMLLKFIHVPSHCWRASPCVNLSHVACHTIDRHLSCF